MPETARPEFIQTSDGTKLAYHRSSADAKLQEKYGGALPGVIFLGGFRSDMNGSKALALEEACKSRGQPYIRFDYTGHGDSEGRFEDGTISSWTQDALTIIDGLTVGPQILIGSSMGGWIGLLCARARPERVAAFIGIAAAPDFTDDRIWEELGAENREKMDKDGYLEVETPYDPMPYRITKALLEDGQKNCILNDRLELSMPIRLLQGMKDADVPWDKAMRIMEVVSHDDLEVILVKNGDHRLSQPRDISRLIMVLDSLNEQLRQ